MSKEFGIRLDDGKIWHDSFTKETALHLLQLRKNLMSTDAKLVRRFLFWWRDVK